MKKTPIKMCATLFALGVFFIAGPVEAAVLYSQPAFTSTNGLTANSFNVGNTNNCSTDGVTGFLVGITLSIVDTSNTGTDSAYILFRYRGSSATAATSQTITYNKSTTAHSVYFPLDTVISLDGDCVSSGGSFLSNWYFNVFTSAGNVQFTTDTSFGIFRLDGLPADRQWTGSLEGPDVIALSSQVLAVQTPTQFQVTTSVNVPVQFTYLYNSDTGVLDRVGIELTDQQNNRLVLRTGEQALSLVSGVKSYSSVLGLSVNQAYRIRPYLRNASSSASVYGPYVDFSTISDQYFGTSSPLTLISQITEANAATSTQLGMLSFLSLNPFYFMQKFPFSWLMEVVDTVDQVNDIPATTFYAFTFNFPQIGSSTSMGALLPAQWTFLSTTTISYYLNDGLRTTFRGLVTMVVAVLFGFYVFRRLTRMFV